MRSTGSSSGNKKPPVVIAASSSLEKKTISLLRVSAESIFPAPADVVYGIIADHRDGHPHIVPKKYFSDLEVEQGGVGAGTVICFNMTVLSSSIASRAVISEPEPGRVLVETNLHNEAVTSFTVVPVDNGLQSCLTIATELRIRSGLVGAAIGFLAKLIFRRIYRQELEQLAIVAKKAFGELG